MKKTRLITLLSLLVGIVLVFAACGETIPLMAVEAVKKLK